MTHLVLTGTELHKYSSKKPFQILIQINNFEISSGKREKERGKYQPDPVTAAPERKAKRLIR